MVQVGSVVVAHSPSVWPVAGMASVSRVSPQTEQVRAFSPSMVQVGSVVVAHSPSVWSTPAAGMASLSRVSPQTVHCSSFRPSFLQVAGVTVTHSPSSWPEAGMASVFVPLQTEQVKVFTPSLVQVGSVVTAPLSQV